ncbi:ComC/BlpC family leader-containing pheromone/bacteriocin [Leuconostoc sp. MS02]|uniref:ComC/BlpC family leader-containing pheromone/bacteriocin n=1 Tax=Leuconostoc aquikimchii TaxID=3236804 RepID=A0ABV3S0G2_9LACO
MKEINNFQRINNDDLNKISGGVFSTDGEIVGSGLYLLLSQ